MNTYFPILLYVIIFLGWSLANAGYKLTNGTFSDKIDTMIGLVLGVKSSKNFNPKRLNSTDTLPGEKRYNGYIQRQLSQVGSSNESEESLTQSFMDYDDIHDINFHQYSGAHVRLKRTIAAPRDCETICNRFAYAGGARCQKMPWLACQCKYNFQWSMMDRGCVPSPEKDLTSGCQRRCKKLHHTPVKQHSCYKGYCECNRDHSWKFRGIQMCVPNHALFYTETPLRWMVANQAKQRQEAGSCMDVCRTVDKTIDTTLCSDRHFLLCVCRRTHVWNVDTSSCDPINRGPRACIKQCINSKNANPLQYFCTDIPRTCMCQRDHIYSPRANGCVHKDVITKNYMGPPRPTAKFQGKLREPVRSQWEKFHPEKAAALKAKRDKEDDAETIALLGACYSKCNEMPHATGYNCLNTPTFRCQCNETFIWSEKDNKCVDMPFSFGPPMASGGAAGASQAGTGQAGAGQTGAGQAGAGQAEAGQAVAGQAGAGQAVAGQAGAGQAVAGQAGAGQAVAGQAGTEQETGGGNVEAVENVDTGDPLFITIIAGGVLLFVALAALLILSKGCGRFEKQTAEEVPLMQLPTTPSSPPTGQP